MKQRNKGDGKNIKIKKGMVKTITAIVTMGIMMAAAYWLGRMHVEPTECKMAAGETKTDIVSNEYVRYIDMDSENFQDNFIDMRKVVDYTATEDGLYLYLEYGSGYYWER